MKNRFIKETVRLFIVIGLILGSALAAAEVAIIVHPSNTNILSKSDIKLIYLAKRVTYPDGKKVSPIDQQEGSLIREMFTSNVIGKNSNKLKSYWAKLLFTGQGTPPAVEVGDDNVKKVISKDPSSIGYIDSANVDDTVKVVFKF